MNKCFIIYFCVIEEFVCKLSGICPALISNYW